MRSPLVNIIIVNYKTWQDAQACIDSVLTSDYRDYRVFLVDNNSENNSVEHLTVWLRQAYPLQLFAVHASENLIDIVHATEPGAICFIGHHRNEGFAAGNNLVLQYLQEDDSYIWLLNPDMIVQRDTLALLVDFAGKQTQSTIIGNSIHSSAGNHALLFYGGGKVNFSTATVSMIRRKEQLDRLEYISGGSLFTHVSAFKKAGLLPENYFLYWEETDWCFRARQLGYRMAVCTEAVCLDKVSTSIGKGFTGDYYYTLNGLRFVSRFRPSQAGWVIFFNGFRFLKRIVSGQWSRARGVWKGTFDFLKQRKNEVQ
jgi:GT2 family glycosyltransferase